MIAPNYLDLTRLSSPSPINEEQNERQRGTRPLWWRLGMRPLWWHLHPARLRRVSQWAALSALIVIGGGVLSLWLISLSPWPPLLTLRHFAAFPNCAAARAVGL